MWLLGGENTPSHKDACEILQFNQNNYAVVPLSYYQFLISMKAVTLNLMCSM